MYMHDIKLFAKKWKRIRDSNTNNKNIQPGYRNGIWRRKMRQANYEKQKNNKYLME